jgi:Dicarboxylate transport
MAPAIFDFLSKAEYNHSALTCNIIYRKGLLKMTEDTKKTKKPLKQRLGRVFIWVNFLLLVLLCLVLYVIYFLPQYLQHEVLPDAVSSLPFDISDAKIRRVGLSGADIGNIYLWNKGGGSIEIASMRVDYSPSELLFGNTVHIESLSLSGVALKCVVRDGQLNFPNLQMGSSGKSATANGEKSKYKFKIDWIKIESGIFIVENGPKSFRIPFSLAITSQSDDFRECVVYGKLFPRSNPIEFTSKVNLAKKQVSVTGRAVFLLERFADLLPKGLLLKGHSELDFKAHLGFDPVKVHALKAECKLQEFSLTQGALTLKNMGSAAKLTASGKGDKFTVSLTGLLLDGAVPVELCSIDNIINLVKDGVDVVTKVDCRVSRLPGNAKLALPVRFAPEIISHYKHDGSWGSHSTSNKPLSTGFKVEIGKNKLSSSLISWDMNAHSKHGKPEADLTIKMKKLKNSTSIVKAEIPELKVTAAYADGFVKGELSFAGGTAVSDKHKVKISGIESQLPFKLPQGKKTTDGTFKIKRMTWKGKDAGAFKSKIRLGAKKALLLGALNCKLVPGLRVEMFSRVDWSGIPVMSLGASVPKFKIAETFKPGELVPALQGMTFSGVCAANAKIVYKAGQVSSSAKLSVSDAAVKKEDVDLTIDGIDLQLELTDLMALKSKPDQKLSFKNFKVGAVNVYDGKVDFQIESPEAMLLEKSSFGWCGGHLYTHALRVVAGRNSYQAMIFCDGIVLSQLLNELGVAKASGAGEVMGRIPVLYDERGFTFDSGFLFSVPGQGNKLKLVDTDKLLSGIPKETAQFAQLDIASEALKDFDYQWVKINLATEKDVLKVKMQIDGKPTNLLPFTYDKKKGYFVRVKGKGARFQGICLNVNTNVPLNKLMLFNNKLQSKLQKSSE